MKKFQRFLILLSIAIMFLSMAAFFLQDLISRADIHPSVIREYTSQAESAAADSSSTEGSLPSSAESSQSASVPTPAPTVPPKTIDTSQPLVTAEEGVSQEITDTAETRARQILSTEASLRTFLGNGWQVVLVPYVLEDNGNSSFQIGETDTGTRRITVTADYLNDAIDHEFGHYLADIYECNRDGSEDTMNQLYASEGAGFVSFRSEENSAYGQQDTDEFIASVFDNVINGYTYETTPQTEAYVSSMYADVLNMDFETTYSVGYDVWTGLRDIMTKAENAGWTVLLDGTQIDPGTYDIHDFTKGGYRAEQTGTTVTITSIDSGYETAAEEAGYVCIDKKSNY